MAWFSYPDGMDHEETQSLTPIASDSPWLERCGTLLRPQNDPALFGLADADLYFAADGQPRFYVMRIRRRPPVLKSMTRHHRCLLYTSPSPRDYAASRMPSSA